ncbi:MAG: FHA domain-containing protein [Acidimicrobiales bacterium]
MPEPALRFLEYVFLALLYLFFLRVVRAVWVELREPRLVGSGPAVTGPPPARKGAPAGPAGRPGASLKLVVVSADGARGSEYELSDELTIGRAQTCAVVLGADNFVSQLHARVFNKADGYWVEDLGSTNGTLVNGRRVSGAVPLERGDRLQVGRTVLELHK